MLVTQFGRFVAETQYESLPAAVVDAVKIRVLDLITSGLVGHRLGSARQLLACLGGEPEATVWGVGTRYALRDAVLLNSFLAHSTYLDDGSRYTGGHPSSVVTPAAIALGETRHASGREVIVAIAKGYEVFLRLGRALYPSIVARGFQSTAVLGAVSSAAACASLLRLDARQSANALAIACSLGVGLKEALRSSGSQPIQVGRSCEGGVLAALYAQEGAPGADTIIENGMAKAFGDGVDLGGAAAGLGTDYRIFETYIKVHGGCRGNHAPVDLAQDIARDNGVHPDDIERIDIAVDSVTMAAEIHAPKTGTEAQFSVAFSVAVALVEGDASVFRYTDAELADPRVAALMQRVHVVVDRDLDRGYPDRRGAHGAIVLRGGRRCEGAIGNARGEPEYPLSAADVERKFMVHTRDILGARAADVRDAVNALDELPDVGALARLLVAAEPAAPGA